MTKATTSFWLIIELLIASVITGCMAVDQVKTVPGTDLTLVRSGVTCAEIERMLGPPLRVWSPNSEVEYRLYDILLPLEGSPTEAAAVAFIDVATVGLWELLYAVDGETLNRSRFQEHGRIWVGYDSSCQAFGHFEEFDPLPRNPRPAVATGIPG